jgi:primosomal protein N'
MKYKTSSVYILNVPYHIDRLYTYYIPDDLKNDVLCGSIVTVPFGGGNKHVAAMVYALSETDDIHEIKPIISVSSNVTLSDEEIKLSLFLKDNCFCTVGYAIKAIVPSVVMNKVTELYKASDKPIDETSIGFGSFIVYQFVRDNGATLTYSQSYSYIAEDGLRHWVITRKVPTNTSYTLKTKLGYTWTTTELIVST